MTIFGIDLLIILMLIGFVLLLAAIVGIFGLVGMGVNVILWMIFYMILGVGFIEFILGGLPEIDIALHIFGV